MAISDKTRKILWARSGNRCAICRCELTMEASETDGDSVIGEECHIVARRLDGPRGDDPLPLRERDLPENLILLCRNHHKEVDGRLNEYTVARLRELKVQHESWVQDKLMAGQKPTPVLFFVYRIDSGAQLCNSVTGCDALHFSNDQPETREAALLVSGFSQLMHDYLDIWSVMESGDRVMAQFELHRELSQLADGGFLVYGVTRRERYRFARVDRALTMSVGYVMVVRNTNPLTKRKDQETEELMQAEGQGESEFTNFIPVLREGESIGFV